MPLAPKFRRLNATIFSQTCLNATQKFLNATRPKVLALKCHYFLAKLLKCHYFFRKLA